ncbi:exodeoxyribonuclease III [Yinghuangia seranimata]|uniref:exodeoxyribonuclease III n=1 Tax=Yinghuangia seranimata TaxID=408067 RepID=UPI00248D1709|nr:exodeoxyribonuclease III [Yinghuangia seranimata]MDI2124911.1 exodeoxyribonuclease III [Yinghuangia seranimata]
MFTVTSVNVNGLRAATGKGFTAWLEDTSADVVCLQEVRAEPHQLTDAVREPEGWHTVYAPSVLKGRAGVAVYTRRKPLAHRIGFGSDEFDAAGRWIEVDLPGVTVASLYLPTGEAETPKQEEKHRFMAGLEEHLVGLRASAAEDGREVLVCGDWNIGHAEADIKNWKGNLKKSGFLPEERAWLTRLYGELGYHDVVRELHPGVAGPYSWWSMRGKAFDIDSGWRIDLQVATDGLAKTAVSAVTERAASYGERWSDHAPVTVTYDFTAK